MISCSPRLNFTSKRKLFDDTILFSDEEKGNVNFILLDLLGLDCLMRVKHYFDLMILFVIFPNKIITIAILIRDMKGYTKIN